ncbi:hypothetical protein SGLAM104S_08356 [Streptomyces glaucescens]
MFDLRRLRLLRELKHRGTLAAVAAALSYAPSSVSQQLSQLEAEAGVPLLEPVGRRVRLTEQAEILVAHTEAVLERLERAEADIAASLTDLTGTLRIAAFQTAALALVPTALGLLRARHPQLRVHVTQLEPEQALPALAARDFDLVVAEEYPGDPSRRPAGLEEEHLLDDPLRLALPKPPGGPDAVAPGTGAGRWGACARWRTVRRYRTGAGDHARPRPVPTRRTCAERRRGLRVGPAVPVRVRVRVPVAVRVTVEEATPSEPAMKTAPTATGPSGPPAAPRHPAPHRRTRPDGNRRAGGRPGERGTGAAGCAPLGGPAAEPGRTGPLGGHGGARLLRPHQPGRRRSRRGVPPQRDTRGRPTGRTSPGASRPRKR